MRLPATEQLRARGVVARDGLFRGSRLRGAVRRNLFELQHHKCCYCECRIDRSYSDVEHFRPLSRYWWLAYAWENLLLACKFCNQTAKRDHFELMPGCLPLQPEQLPPGGERSKLLDPARVEDDLTDHIRYVHHPILGRWVPVPRNGSERGRYTIAVLRLGQDRALDQQREDEEVAVRCLTRWRTAVRRADVQRQRELWDKASALVAVDKRFLAMKRAILADILETPRP